jgi:hypothetical protein
VQFEITVPALEDKIVQRATVEVLNAIYEMDFLGFSYGFRPGRSQHNWVLDVDIRGFFDAIDHGWRAIHRAPACGPRRRAPHPEMVERWRVGGGEANASGVGDAAGRQKIAAAGEPLSPLRV